MREGLILFNRVACFVGITPAYAGRTGGDTAALTDFEDHPRVCGKDSSMNFKNCLSAGSPPRVREGPASGYVEAEVRGITPACAGRT